MIETILKCLNRCTARLPVNSLVPQDKEAHFVSGFILFFLLLLCQMPPEYAVITVSLAGVAKEVYDHYHPLEHTADVYDWLATALGGVAGFGLWWLV